MIDPTLYLDARLYHADANGKPGFASFIRATGASHADARGRLLTAPAGMLRHDSDPLTGQYLGWQIDEQRTNRALGSADLGNAGYWAPDGVTVTAGAAMAPDGNMAAARLTYSSGNNRLHQPMSIPAGATPYTLSAYVRADTAGYTQLVINTTGGADPTTGTNVAINFAAGTATVLGGAGTAAIRAVGGGWYRLSVTHTSSASHNLLVAYAYGSTDAAGAATAGASYWWGLQCEAGPAASSYIATTTAQVTRAADLLTLPVSAFPFNPAEGTLFIDFSCPHLASYYGVLGLTDGSTSNNLISLFVAGSDIYARMRVGGVDRFTFLRPLAVGRNRVAFGFRPDDYAMVVNGGSVGTSSAAGALPAGLTLMDVFGAQHGHVNSNTGHVRHIAYFPRRLTNANLQDLTRL